MLDRVQMQELRLLQRRMIGLRPEFLQLKRDWLNRRRYAHDRKYSSSQPRVPAGNADGGQWTSGSGGGASTWSPAWPWSGDNPIDPARDNPPANESQPFFFDLSADADSRISADFASSRRSPPGSWPGASPGQQARLAASDVQAQAAIRRVQEIDANWRPAASLSEGIEGAILSNQAAVRQAQARYRELQADKVVSGSFATDAVRLSVEGKRLTQSEQREINRIGSIFGCHSCGTTVPGTNSGNFVGDHQRPTALNPPGTPQLAYHHCKSCSLSQGGHVLRYLRSRK